MDKESEFCSVNFNLIQREYDKELEEEHFRFKQGVVIFKFELNAV